MVVRMPCPFIILRINLFIPAVWAHQVDLAVAIYVAEPYAVSGTFVPNNMLNPLRFWTNRSKLVPYNLAAAVRENTELALTQNGRDNCRFSAARLCDQVFRP